MRLTVAHQVVGRVEVRLRRRVCPPPTFVAPSICHGELDVRLTVELNVQAEWFWEESDTALYQNHSPLNRVPRRVRPHSIQHHTHLHLR